MKKSAESTIMVSKVFSKDGVVVSEEHEAETIAVHVFATETAEVGVTMGSTINLGDYNSARVDVYCKVPSYIEELDEAYEFASNFAEKKIKLEIREINGFARKNRGDSSPL